MKEGNLINLVSYKEARLKTLERIKATMTIVAVSITNLDGFLDIEGVSEISQSLRSLLIQLSEKQGRRGVKHE